MRFGFNVPCQYTLLTLRPLIFGLTLFGWLRSITLNRTCSIIPHGTIIFDCRPRFQEHNWGVQQGLGLWLVSATD
jgi:hypothetical protein